jgi:uncharacterized protein
VVKVGDKIRVRVLEVDQQRKRISLSARKGEGKPRNDRGGADRKPADRAPARGGSVSQGKARAQGGKFDHRPFASLGSKKGR